MWIVEFMRIAFIANVLADNSRLAGPIDDVADPLPLVGQMHNSGRLSRMAVVDPLLGGYCRVVRLGRVFLTRDEDTATNVLKRRAARALVGRNERLVCVAVVDVVVAKVKVDRHQRFTALHIFWI